MGRSQEMIKKSLDMIPLEIRNDILNSKSKKDYDIPNRLLRSNSSGGYLAHAFQELLYCCGLNGKQEVRYQKGRKITISSDGVRALQQKLGEITPPFQ